jgi:hypothetical protein
MNGYAYFTNEHGKEVAVRVRAVTHVEEHQGADFPHPQTYIHVPSTFLIVKGTVDEVMSALRMALPS